MKKTTTFAHWGKLLVSLLLTGVILLGCASCKTTMLIRFQDQNGNIIGNSGDSAAQTPAETPVETPAQTPAADPATAAPAQSASASAENNSAQTASNPVPAPEETTKAEPSVLSVGTKVATDLAELTLTKVQFADRLGLDSDNWLKPKSDFGGFTPGDGKVFFWFSFTVKNIAKQSKLEPLHFWEAKINYNDGFIFEDAVFASEDLPKWSTSSGISKPNVGLNILDPLQECVFYGHIPCVAEVETNTQAPLLLVISLKESTGLMKEFTYKIR